MGRCDIMALLFWFPAAGTKKNTRIFGESQSGKASQPDQICHHFIIQFSTQKWTEVFLFYKFYKSLLLTNYLRIFFIFERKMLGMEKL